MEETITNCQFLCRLEKYFEKMWLDVPSFEDPSKEDSVFRAVVHIDPHAFVFVIQFFHLFIFRTVVHIDPHVFVFVI